MKRIVACLASAALAASMVAVAPAAVEQAQADENGMTIRAIQLAKNSGAKVSEDDEQEMGDAVLVESAGKYLLMDTGAEYVSDSVVKYLKNVGVKELDVYISHVHPDHCYGIDAIMKNFTVNTVYMPDKSIGSKWVSGSGATLEQVYTTLLESPRAGHENFKGISAGSKQVVYLKKGSTFTVGNVTANVLGPVGTYSMSQKWSNNVIGHESGHYLNNYSLTTMLTCGDTKFLTTGDIEAEEEASLVKEYGAALKADILKMPHHGLDTSNTVAFLNAVKPTWSFAENMGYEDSQKTSTKGETYQVSKNYQALQRYHDVGFAYLVGSEGASLVIKAENGTVSLYRDKDANGVGTQLKGKVQVKGDGLVSKGTVGYYGNNTYYFDANSKPISGLQKISGKWYNLSKGGVVAQGSITKVKGKYVYNQYRKYNKKGQADLKGKLLRAYDQKTDAMAVGPTYVKNVNTGKSDWFMFNSQGYRVDGTKKAAKSLFGLYTWGDKNYVVTGKESKIYNYTSKTKNLIMGNQTVKVKKGLIVKSKKSGTGDANLKAVKMGQTKGVKVAAGAAKNTVTWKKTPGAKGYYVLRSTLKGDGYEVIKTINKGSTKKFVDKTAKSGTAYFYKVQAFKKFVKLNYAGKASAPVEAATL